MLTRDAAHHLPCFHAVTFGLIPRHVVGGFILSVLLVLWSATAFAKPSFPSPAAIAPVPSETTLPKGTPMAPPNAVPAGPQPAYRDPASHVEVYDVLTVDMFPTQWHSPPIAAAALPMAATERDRALRLVKVALSKYPPAFLHSNLKRIYLVGSLKFNGINVAGTNSATSLYLEVREHDPLYTDPVIENTFHHEFAHLSQRNYRKQWSAGAWAACNPSDFHYGAKSGAEAVRSGHASTRWTDNWNRRGFLSEYGASDASEDFATITSKLFLGDPTFWSRVDRFPALKAKAEAATAFYASLDPRFNSAFFRGLHIGVIYVAPT